MKKVLLVAVAMMFTAGMVYADAQAKVCDEAKTKSPKLDCSKAKNEQGMAQKKANEEKNAAKKELKAKVKEEKKAAKIEVKAKVKNTREKSDPSKQHQNVEQKKN